jgi:mRNA export factor
MFGGGGGAFGGGGGGAFGGGGGAFGGGGGFGQAQTSGGFGAQPAAAGFGAQPAAGFGAAAATGGFGAAAKDPNPNQDKLCSPAPQDSVSSMKWSPASGGRTHLSATCWDGTIVVYAVDAQGGTTVPVSNTHPSQVPCLGADWHTDGSKIFSCYGDNTAHMFDLTTQALTQIGQHQAPVSTIAWSGPLNSALTGSWDKTLKFWTPGNPTAVGTINLPERCYTMDLIDEYVVVGCADRKVAIYDVRQCSQGNTQPLKSEVSPLKFQTRTVAMFPEKDGYAIGSIEGKVGIQYFQETGTKKHFSFRCHRSEGNGKQDVYAVNCIAFNKQYQTFATVGADGVYNFWDKTNKQRLKQFKPLPEPITAAAFSHDSTIFAYASCYDWHKGIDGLNPASPKQVYLHSCTPQELQKRPKNRR